MTRRIKTPTVYQMEISECGAAALCMVLGYYGAYVPMEQLRDECSISRDGSKANNILRAARLHGLVASGYKREIAELKNIKCPVILFWEFNHYVVLEGVKKNGYYINDPAEGHRFISEAEFSKSFTGIVLELNKGPAFKSGGVKPNAFAELLKNLSNLKTAILFLLVNSLCLALLALVLPASIRLFIDASLIEKSLFNLNYLVLFLIGSALVTGLIFLLFGQMSFRLSKALILTATGRFYWHVLRLPVSFFLQRYPSDIASLVKNSVALSKKTAKYLILMVVNFLSAVVFLVILAFYDIVFAAICLGVFLLNAVLMKFVSEHYQDVKSKIISEKNSLLSSVMTGLGHIENLKVHGAEVEFFNDFTGKRAKKCNAESKILLDLLFIKALPQFLLVVALVVLFIVGSFNVFSGEITIGMLVACLVLVAMIVLPMNQLFMIFHEIKNCNIEQSQISDIRNYKVAPCFRKNEKDIDEDIKDLTGLISVRALSFSYDRYSEKPTIQNFNLETKPGSKIAIVGPSGSGKSTIAKLICGLYEPLSGELLFEGVKIKQIQRQVISRRLACASQNVELFSGTIWENLTLYNPEAQTQDVEQAAKDALFYDDIKNNLAGFYGPIDINGCNLSGGEKQRLEIARNLSINPAILILDECTSALDAYTEKLIFDKLKNRKMTCIFITHRLSSIKDCDEIIVLDDGLVAQRGTHDELFAKKGMYRNLAMMS